MPTHKTVRTQDALLLAGQRLASYAVAVMPSFELAPHNKLIIQNLEAVERGEINRLMIFMPPRHGKSLLTTMIFPGWYLGRHPERNVITTTYSQDLSDDFGRRVRNMVIDPMHRAIFPNFLVAEDSSAVRRFNTSLDGSYFAVGRGGSITGRGADLFLIDDPLKDADEARSEMIRRSMRDWYTQVVRTRLHRGGAIVIVQTRWHEDDLAGWLLRDHQDQNWNVLSLPAVAEQDEVFRREGEALWPTRYSLTELEATRRDIGGAAWAALYQQRPAAAQGAVFLRDWWHFYDREPESFKRLVVSVDSAFKTGAENDYTVMQLWGETATGFYLLVNLKQRVEFPALKRVLVNLYEQRRPHAVLVEDAASGQSLIQELRSSTSLPLRPIKPDRDKVSRAQAVTPLVEAGRVFIPSNAPWSEDFLDELSSFPYGRHDDQVDALTQALNYLRASNSGVLDYYRELAEQAGPGADDPRTPKSSTWPARLYGRL